jgi:stringent starvation protein B
MKRKLIRTLFSFLLVVSVATVTNLYAQDAGEGEVYETDDVKDKEPLFSSGESESYHRLHIIPISKDSATSTSSLPITPKTVVQRSVKTSTDVPKTQAKQPEDDSILSFNFLYYIIQRYKLQDIVD